MRLIENIDVNTLYTRSIHLERDNTSGWVPYIPTGLAIHVLTRIAEALDNEAMPRSFALIGPYGSGKSAFGLYLAQLLGDQRIERTRTAISVLAAADPKLSRQINDAKGDLLGFCTITLTGSPDLLGKSLLHAVKKGVIDFFDKESTVQQLVLDRIDVALAEGVYEVGFIVSILADLQEAVAQCGGCGVLILIDELGKFLEHDVHQGGVRDIYLLQALSEHGFKANDAPLILVTLLHQSFEHYAASIGNTLRNEWRKVQGRFESIPFIESADQTIRLIQSALSNTLDNEYQEEIRRSCIKITETLIEENAIPPSLTIDQAVDLFSSCYPLHPVTLLLLPSLCQKVAQNERTLFSYLGGKEPYGLLDSISRLTIEPNHIPWIGPGDLYHYFILNQQGFSTDGLTRRRWAELTTAIDRIGDSDQNQIETLKIIGLMNIAGQQRGLRPSLNILSSILDQEHLAETINSLSRKSAITYRRYSNEYRVWQGSDFDLDAAIAEQISLISSIDVAELLNERKPISPIIARRHSISTGSLRYYQPYFISRKNKFSGEASAPTLIIAFSQNMDDDELLSNVLRSYSKDNAIGVLVACDKEIHDSVVLAEAIERLQANNSQLLSDPVAQRELLDRASVIKQKRISHLSSILDTPRLFTWFVDGDQIFITSRPLLQRVLSDKCDRTYSSSPIIMNELINREKPSATAIAGRNKLISAMFNSSDVADLDIKKFPAEKAMYRSLLLATGLHYCDSNGYHITSEPAHDKYNVRPLFERITEELDQKRASNLPISELFRLLSLPPYGIKAGVIPVLFLTFLLSRLEEIAIYEEGNYVPFITEDVYERLIKSPKLFGLQLLKHDDQRQAVYKRYIEIVDGEVGENVSLIAAAKSVARMMFSLPEYTKRTHSLKPEPRRVKELFFEAKSPAILLLDSIPASLGYEPLTDSVIDPGELEQLFARIQMVFGDLRSAYHGLLVSLQRNLKDAFSIDQKTHLHELRALVKERVSGLDQYTTDAHGLQAYIGRLVDAFGDESQWLLSVASFLGRKPPEKWSDDDVQSAEQRMKDFARRINDLQKMRLHHEGAKTSFGDDVEVHLLRSVRSGSTEQDFMINIDANLRTNLASVVSSTHECMSQLSKEQKLATIALMLEQIESGGD